MGEFVGERRRETEKEREREREGVVKQMCQNCILHWIWTLCGQVVSAAKLFHLSAVTLLCAGKVKCKMILDFHEKSWFCILLLKTNFKSIFQNPHFCFTWTWCRAAWSPPAPCLPPHLLCTHRSQHTLYVVQAVYIFIYIYKIHFSAHYDLSYSQACSFCLVIQQNFQM